MLVKSRGCELLAGRGRREVIGSVSRVRGEPVGSLGVRGVWESPGSGARVRREGKRGTGLEGKDRG